MFQYSAHHCHRYGLQVISEMRAGVVVLQAALVGNANFSAAVVELASALQRGTTPSCWARLHPPNGKPLGAWLAWLARRHHQYVGWAQVRA